MDSETRRVFRPDDDVSDRLRRARGGDDESLSWICSRFSPWLECQAALRLGPLTGRIDPADIAQEVWRIVLPRLGDLQANAAGMTPVLVRFLSTTLVHVSNNLLRKVLRGEEPRSSMDGFDPETTRRVRNASGVARADEDARLLRDAIAKLDDDAREAVILRGLEQIPNATAAERLGVTPNTLSQRYRRALERLAEVLPDELREHFENS